ncbi:MAG: C-GCAxxG-C-C family (seleno)protein [Desulfobacteraceae bacterium]
MIKKDTQQIAAKKAADYFGNGYHCAEAVATAVLETLGQDATEATAHGTAFGGGVGRTYKELCGALSGGLIVIGHLYGRRQCGEEWDLPAELGAELRQNFVNHFGTCHCGALREKFGLEKQMDECRKIVHNVADTLFILLSEER